MGRSSKTSEKTWKTSGKNSGILGAPSRLSQLRAGTSEIFPRAKIPGIWGLKSHPPPYLDPIPRFPSQLSISDPIPRSHSRIPLPNPIPNPIPLEFLGCGSQEFPSFAAWDPPPCSPNPKIFGIFSQFSPYPRNSLPEPALPIPTFQKSLESFPPFPVFPAPQGEEPQILGIFGMWGPKSREFPAEPPKSLGSFPYFPFFRLFPGIPC